MTSAWSVRIFGSIVTVTVTAAVVAAIVILGPPKHQRQRKLDDRRVHDMTTIEKLVESYWQRHKTLPPDLVTLSKEPGFGLLSKDPERGDPYEYKITGTESFRLCAVFAFDSAEEAAAWNYPMTGTWAHGPGRQCFDLEIPDSTRDDSK